MSTRLQAAADRAASDQSDKTPEASPETGKPVDQASIDQAVAKAVSAERERCLSVIGDEKAKGKTGAAIVLLKAANGAMSSAEVLAALDEMPAAAAEKPTENGNANMLATMEANGAATPKLEADASGTAADASKGWDAAYAKAGLTKSAA